MVEGIRKNKFPGKTKEDLAFDCDMYIYCCLICPSILVQPCPKECTVHPDNFCQLRTSWRSLLSWQVGFFFHFPFYIWMHCMKINSPSHNQSPETGWLHCRHRLLLQVWQLMIPRTEWDSLITVVRKGTTRKTQCDEDNFCLLVKIRLENTSHTCIFFIQLLVWWSLDDLWLSSLGSCFARENHRHCCSDIHFSKAQPSSVIEVAEFYPGWKLKEKGANFAGFVWGKSQVVVTGSATKPQCTMTREVRELCVPCGICFRPSLDRKSVV